MSQYWADLEQQEYDPDEFVERLAFRFEAASRGVANWPYFFQVQYRIPLKDELMTLQGEIWKWRRERVGGSSAASRHLPQRHQRPQIYA